MAPTVCVGRAQRSAQYGIEVAHRLHRRCSIVRGQIGADQQRKTKGAARKDGYPQD
jgi:hypothetical protein